MRTMALVVVVILSASGCVTVKPSEKQYLSDPAMTYASGGEADEQEQHVLDNREASYGAGSARGGGCGCN